MKVIGERATRRLQAYADYRVVADPIERISILSEKQRFLLSAGKEVNINFLNYYNYLIWVFKFF